MDSRICIIDVDWFLFKFCCKSIKVFIIVPLLCKMWIFWVVFFVWMFYCWPTMEWGYLTAWEEIVGCFGRDVIRILTVLWLFFRSVMHLKIVVVEERNQGMMRSSFYYEAHTLELIGFDWPLFSRWNFRLIGFCIT